MWYKILHIKNSLVDYLSSHQIVAIASFFFFFFAFVYHSCQYIKENIAKEGSCSDYSDYFCILCGHEYREYK